MINRGDIYWIAPNQYRYEVGSVQAPNRPAVIVSNNENNDHSTTVEIVYLTTAPKKNLPTHTVIRSANSASTALCEQISTISVEQLGDYMGKVTPDEMYNIETCMLVSLGIDLGSSENDQPAESAPSNNTPEPQIGANVLVHTSAIQKEAEIYKSLYFELLGRITAK